MQGQHACLDDVDARKRINAGMSQCKRKALQTGCSSRTKTNFTLVPITKRLVNFSRDPDRGRACMGKRPCQEKKNDAQEVGLMNHRNTHVRMVTANAVIVLDAWSHIQETI